MKSEHRHELKTNELANRLGTGIEKVQPYSQWVLGGVVVLAVAAIGWGIYSSVTQKSASKAWTEYYFSLNTGDAEAFTAVADSYPGSAAALWAQQTAGDEYLADGIEALYRNRSQGQELVKKAVESYAAVNTSAYQPELRTRAQLGLAQSHESLGELDKAKEYYQQVVSAGLQPALTSVASNRLAFLNSPAGKEFYTWFDTFKPGPTKPLDLPGNMNSVPTSPDIKFGPAGSPLDTSKLELPQGTSEGITSDSAPLKLELPPADGVAPAIPQPSVPVAEPALPTTEPTAAEATQPLPPAQITEPATATEPAQANATEPAPADPK